MLRRVLYMAVAALTFFPWQQVLADTAADTLEQKILSAAHDRRIVNDLGQAFQRDPSGEFLLAPANRDLRFAILIYNIDILPEKAVFSAGLAFREPHSNHLVAFNTDQVQFSYANGISGNVLLYLVDTVKMHFGKMATVSLNPGLGQTQAVMDCSGLNSFICSGGVEFNSGYIIPCDDTGRIKPGNLHSSFHFACKNWNEILADISVEPFQLRGMKDFVFSLQHLVLDLSENTSVPSFMLPQGYRKLGMFEMGPEAWEGFYLASGTIRFPKYFKTDRGLPLVISFTGLLIDDMGITGAFSAQNLLPFGSGNLGGWDFGIQVFTMNIFMNRLEEVSFKGELGLPVLPDTSALIYYASLSSNDHYLFSIGNRNQLMIPALKAARVTIDQNSFVSAEIIGGKINLEANLNGSLCIITSENSKSGEVKADLPGIEFQDMHLSNRSPKFSISYLGLKQGNGSLSNFPVQITDLAFKSDGVNHSLELGLSLNLTEYAAAACSFVVLSNSTVKNGRDRLTYSRTTLSSLSVDFEKSGMLVHGSLIMFAQDPDYGSGFRGDVVFQLRNPQLTLSATALFGNVNSTRYWYSNAEVLFPAPGIVLGPGINANGFVGGAWHRLKPWDGNRKLNNPGLGLTPSGVVLVPDASSGLGLRAGVWLNGGSSKSYLAKTVLELYFQNSGSLDQVLFSGEVQVLPKTISTSKDQLAASGNAIPKQGSAWSMYCAQFKPQAEISGPFLLNYDFGNRCFTANAALYLYQASNNTVNGALTNYLAGEIGMYFSPGTWFVYAGRPDQPLSVMLSLGNLAGVKTTSYFVTGSTVPASPPPPLEITALLGPVTLDKSRDLTQLNSGKGFALGWSLTTEAHAGGTDKKVSVYAGLLAKCALDVNFTSYNPSLYCVESGKTAGINGWYGLGDVYAFLQGKIGASAGKFKIDVMTFTGAMALKFGGPNPVFASGKTLLEFNLGGLFRFTGNMNVNIGEPCTRERSLLPDSGILFSTNPENGDINISPLAALQMTFNVPVNQWISVNNKNIKFRLKECAVSQNGVSCAGRIEVSENGYSGRFIPSNPFAPQKNVQWNIVLDIVEKVGGLEVPVKQNGRIISEAHNLVFSVGTMPNAIPEFNISSSWPSARQVNFYTKQVPKGLVQLKVPQNDLFAVAGCKTIARFSAWNGSGTFETDAVNTNGKIEFALPSALKPSTLYHFRLVRVPVSYVLNSSSGSVSMSASVSSGPGVSAVSLSGAGPAPSIPSVQLLEFSFRTSAYETFQKKIAAFNQSDFPAAFPLTLQPKFSNSTAELFDAFETQNANGFGVTAVAGWNTCNWALSEASAKVYDALKFPNAVSWLTRDTAVEGLPPVKSVSISQSGSSSESLNPAVLNASFTYQYLAPSLTAVYTLPTIVKEDFEDFRDQLLILYSQSFPGVLNMINDFTRNFSAVSGSSPPPSASGAASTIPGGSTASSSAPSAGAIAGISGPVPPQVNRLLNLKFPSLYTPGNYPVDFIFSFPPAGINARNTVSFKLK